MRETVLIVDDEKSIRDTLKTVLEYEKYRTVEADNGQQALNLVREESIDLTLLDIKLPGMDGIEVLKRLKAISPNTMVVMISGHGTISTAVESTQLGAYDFLEKPLDRDRLLLTIRNAIAQKKLSQENQAFRGNLEKKYEIIGESTSIKNILETVMKVGPSSARVLIFGENGTGKELVARAIHRYSNRRDQPFVEVNCAAIPQELIESELFGHEKGAFTGAVSRRAGKFEQAHGGTLFLDEIGDMSLSAQAKVLRVLQENQFERLGGSQTIKVDVRVIAATNKNIMEEIQNNNFREDLYYRLCVVPIHVPPLRERRDDIPLLVQHFLKQFCDENGIKLKKFSQSAISKLKSYDWPGNVRELKNIVERMVIMSYSDVLDVKDIPEFETRVREDISTQFDECRTFQEFKELSEKLFLERRLIANNWNISKTAKELDMERSNLYKKLEKYGLKGKNNSSE